MPINSRPLPSTVFSYTIWLSPVARVLTVAARLANE